MNSDLYRRLFKAIYTEDINSLKKIAKSLVEVEQKKGHNKLAEDLLKIIDKTSIKSNRNITGHSLNSLPTFSYANNGNIPLSHRNNTPLLSYVSYEMLRSDMVLATDVELRLKTIEKEYLARERLNKYGLKPKQKILLYGPPGCGKTLTAERMAKNLGLPLLKVRFDSLISSYFGESSMNLRAVFDYCKKEPVVLLLDECDFIAKSRIMNNDVGEVPRIVNMLLMLLDEYSSEGLVIAATNLKLSLDEALFRRFDDVIEIPIPTEVEIKQLLKTNSGNVKVDSKLNFNDLSKALLGSSAATITMVMQNAAKKAIMSGENIIEERHIKEAVNEVVTKLS